jgi:demethylmenaquinone methyltransferase/2-methoxy-6-polyprenyl-1,4-benzoquinol methylase
MHDAADYIRKLEEFNPLREPVLREAVRALGVPRGSRGLDAGCGIGQPALLLAEAVGPGGHVTGLDISPHLLRYAEKIAALAGMSERVSFREGDIAGLPFDDSTFDWAWSADCAGYPSGELLPLLQEMARVVVPGGTVAVLAFSSQMLLPGHSLLEARLNATCSSYLPYYRSARPEENFLRGLGWLRAAGLEDCAAQTFVGEAYAPLKEEFRVALLSLMDMLWGMRQREASDHDWAEYQRLCRPDSPDFILNAPGYYAFFTYSMFRGKVANKPETK